MLAHGYIDPATYWSGQGFRREQDALARNGYVALHVDYRNHAGSSDDPDNDLTMRLGYAEDVLNAAVAVRASDLPFLDGERIALLGRSMGGSVAFNALVARPGRVRRGDRLRIDEHERRRQLQQVAAARTTGSGRPSSASTVRRRAIPDSGEASRPSTTWTGSPSLFSCSTAPGTRAAPSHGRGRRGTPWSRPESTCGCVEYPGAPHYMYGEWADSMRRSLAFLERHLA